MSWDGVVGLIDMAVSVNTWGVFHFSLSFNIGQFVLSLLISVSLGICVVSIVVVHWVVIGVLVWVVGIVVVLHPFVSVDELVLIVIEGVVVLVSLESMILPVV